MKITRPGFSLLFFHLLTLFFILIPTYGTSGYAPDRILFKFKNESNSRKTTESRNLPENSESNILNNLGLPQGMRIEPGGVNPSQPARTTASTEIDILSGRYQILHLNNIMSVEESITHLKNHPNILYAEPDHIGSGGSIIPNDPSFQSQWHHTKIKMPEVWKQTTGSPDIIVAVLDTGLNTTLSEFQNRLVPGYNFVNNTNSPADDHGHGTAVTGIIAANANNRILGAGIDWQCKIMPLKILDSENLGQYSWWANAIYFAADNGARVINLSAGGSSSNRTLRNAILYAINKGVIFITITHNDGTGTIRFPGSMTETITVGATNRNDTLSSFSNWGPEIDLVAPGNDIFTVNRYGTFTGPWWGTSFAAPQVAGVSSLLLSLRPELKQEDIRLLLRLGAEDRVGDWRDTAGFDNYHGAGRLNALNSLTLATSLPTIRTLPNGSIRLRWNSPPNAIQKRPYQLSYSDNLHNWQPIPLTTNYSQTPTYGEWTDSGDRNRPHPATITKRFYKLSVTE